uniref:Reverse transcriptase Ty1/copia-type domain-containing protein n=1 Tax=Tanacetum cinerariifolium TaxID=118510 RepID=A0A6L2P7J8_TANCI|nr:hypothetical protein [Tanacetum cinerariifolium]
MLVPQQAANDVVADNVPANDVATIVVDDVIADVVAYAAAESTPPSPTTTLPPPQQEVTSTPPSSPHQSPMRLEESQAQVYHIDLEHADKVLSMQDDEPEPATAKLMTKVVTAAATPITAATITVAPRMSYDDIRPIFEKYFNFNMAFLEKSEKELEEYAKRALKRKSKSSEKKAAKKQKLNEEIIKADGTYQLFLSFLSLLRNFNREDLEMLWQIVQERFASSKPTNFSDDFLLTTLKAMFEKPNVEAQMILLVERRYPLIRFTLDQMLNNVRLEVKEESEVSLELLRFVRRQQQEGYRPENKKDKRGIVIKNKARLVAQGFMVYRVDVKSAFLYGRIEEEVYVCQPIRFEDPDHSDKVYKVVKALYGLHQAPRACQDKYVDEVLKKFSFLNVKSANTPVDMEKTLVKDVYGNDVDVYLYRSMIGSLMYLTASRPDIMYAICLCARFQVTHKVSHLHAIKRIFRYLKGHPKLGLWYPRDSPFELVTYTDSDYAGTSLDRKSTTRGFAFLEKPIESEGLEKIIDFLNVNPIKYVLTVNPAIYTSCINQFWATTKVKTINGEDQIHVVVDKKKVIITEISVSDLHLENAEGTEYLPAAIIFKQLTLMGAKTTAWNEFSSTIASAIIYLVTYQKFNFPKYIFDHIVKNLEDGVKGKNDQDMFDISIFDDEEVAAERKYGYFSVDLDSLSRHIINLIAEGDLKKLSDIGACSKEVPSFDKPGPQPQPLPNCPPLDASLGTKRGLKPPTKPQSLDSFRMKVLDNLTIHAPPSSFVLSFHLRDLYYYYLPCIDDPKKHYGLKPSLFGHIGFLGVDFLKLEIIDDDW